MKKHMNAIVTYTQVLTQLLMSMNHTIDKNMRYSTFVFYSSWAKCAL